jgi:hypothetical protein
MAGAWSVRGGIDERLDTSGVLGAVENGDGAIDSGFEELFLAIRLQEKWISTEEAREGRKTRTTAKVAGLAA